MGNTTHISKETGLLALCFWGLIKFIICVALAWFVALIFSFASLQYWGLQNEMKHIYQLWIIEHENLMKITTHSWWQSLVWHVLICLQIMFHNFLIVKTYLMAKLKTFHLEKMNVQHIVKNYFPMLMIYLQAFVLTTAIVIIRLAEFMLFLPVFLLLGVVGLIDGLVQRDLRRLGGGRESALIYHSVRQGVAFCFYAGCFLYLVMPFAIKAAYLLLPFAILFSVAVSLTVKTFKKYL